MQNKFVMAFINYLGIFLGCLCILQAASAQQQAESFNVYYHVDDVSCAGNDGAIRVDSFSCSVTGGSVSGNCYSGGIPASYSCQDSYDHLLSGTGQSATLQNGATYKIDGNYSGNIDFHGNATLYMLCSHNRSFQCRVQQQGDRVWRTYYLSV